MMWYRDVVTSVCYSRILVLSHYVRYFSIGGQKMAATAATEEPVRGRKRRTEWAMASANARLSASPLLPSARYALKYVSAYRALSFSLTQANAPNSPIILW